MNCKRSGFTLVELMVCLSIGGVMATLLLPSVQRARSAARKAQCMNNLRQFGLAFHTFAEHDPNLRFSSGVPSLKDDGCPTTYGWVADLVNNRYALPGEMLCPSNDSVGTTNLHTLLTSKTMKGLGPEDRRKLVPSKTIIESTRALSLERADAVTREILQKNYNTNYTASWFMGRTGVEFRQPIDKLTETHSLDFTKGPITLDAMDRADAPASNIPLLADGAPVKTDAGKLPVGLSSVLKKESLLVAPMLPGPVFWDSGRHEILNVAGKNGTGKAVKSTHYQLPMAIAEYQRTGAEDRQPEPIDQAIKNATSDAQYNENYGGKDGVLWLQDTRGWRIAAGDGKANAVRGRAGRRTPPSVTTANSGHFSVLMCDGAVKTFRDLDGDGLLNPGFPAGFGKESVNGYRTTIVELHPFEIFNGVNLRTRPAKGFFE